MMSNDTPSPDEPSEMYGDTSTWDDWLIQQTLRDDNVAWLARMILDGKLHDIDFGAIRVQEAFSRAFEDFCRDTEGQEIRGRPWRVVPVAGPGITRRLREARNAQQVDDFLMRDTIDVLEEIKQTLDALEMAEHQAERGRAITLIRELREML
jgi:hypothetical protein